jgi:hypothetical protein
MTRSGWTLLAAAAAGLCIVGAFQLGWRLGRPDFSRLAPTPAAAVTPTATPAPSPRAAATLSAPLPKAVTPIALSPKAAPATPKATSP